MFVWRPYLKPCPTKEERTRICRFLFSFGATMADSIDELRVAFIPFSAPGHMIPLMDIARVFARQGADVTFSYVDIWMNIM